MKLKSLIAIFLVLLLTACGKTNSPAANKNIPVKEEPVVEEKFYSPLTGLEINKEDVNKRIYAIMFDNHTKARPQSGLGQANIVYEFKAEGEFTRYMGLFYNRLPDVIGPVRSARPYFINMAQAYNAIYIHWGASEKAYELLRSSGIEELDGIFLEGKTFYRNKEVKKRAPHNGYTSETLIKTECETKGFSPTSELQNFYTFKEDNKPLDYFANAKDVESLKLSIFPSYNVSLKPSGELFNLYRNDEIVIDEATSEPLAFENAIVLYVKSAVGGPLGTLKMDFVGSGEGMYLQNGKYIDILWQRDSETHIPKLSTLSGEEIILTPGKTIFEIVEPDVKKELLPIAEPVVTEEAKESDTIN